MAADISVIATANGKEADGSPAVFSFSRTGDTASALSVSYQLFGTAQAGSDYTGNATGTVTFAAGSSSATLSLPAIADGGLIDPYETIIARINLGASYGITTGKQFATATITAEGMVVIPKGISSPGKSSGEIRRDNYFAALKTDGSVITWGVAGWLPAGFKPPAGLRGVSQIFSNQFAFAALKTDGTVIAWGDSIRGGSVPAGLTGVSQIFSNQLAFAALKTDGTVIAWGDSGMGPGWRSSASGGNAPAGLTGVCQIFSTDSAFAALKNDGTVIAWGDSSLGGSAPAGLTGVSQIFSNNGAFAALKNDGTVIAWGHDSSGGNAPAGLTGVSQIFSNQLAFAALKTDGTVIAWGDSIRGGSVPAGLTGVSQIFSTGNAFAALKTDGSVIAWGESSYGGRAPSGLTGVSQIFSTKWAFAALKTDGSVIGWGFAPNDGESAPAGLTGVVGFANPYTDDRLEIAAIPVTPLPSLPKNSATAAFSISGKGDVGSQLSIIKTKDDPDGNGKFTYKWQSSVDGTNWTNLASTSSFYTVAATDASKQLRATISYLDGKSNSESVDTSALSISAVASQKVIAGDFATPVNINLSLPAYQMSGNWNIDKYFYYVEQYPMTLRTAFYNEYLAGRYTNEALYGQNHYLTGGQAEGRVMVDTSGILFDSNDYGAYVENYGITLLDIYRKDPRAVNNGGTMSLFAWGKEHYTNWGKAEGREITGGVEWGGIVRNNLDLYNQWQDARIVNPTLSAFAFGYQRQNTIKSTLGVLVGSDTSDKLTGQIAYGLNGNDVICSDGGRGILAGGFGDDLLVAANGGSDLAYGGPGSDIFQLNAGSSFNIRDFRKGADMIQVGSTLTSSGVTMQWDSADNSTLFYNGSSVIGKVYGKRPTEFTYSDSTNGVSKVYI